MRQIADRCPVHKTLHEGAAIITLLADDEGGQGEPANITKN